MGHGPDGKAIATGLALIVDDPSVFWQWQADDVLKQPDLVAGCRKEVAYLATSGAALRAGAATAPQGCVARNPGSGAGLMDDLVDNCKQKYVVSGGDLVLVIDYIKAVRAPALAVGLPNYGAIVGSLRSPTWKAPAATPTVPIYRTPQAQLIVHLNATARALIGMNAPSEIHQEYVETYWDQEAAAQRGGVRAPDPSVVAAAVINSRLPNEVAAKAFADQARALQCLIEGRTDCT